MDGIMIILSVECLAMASEKNNSLFLITEIFVLTVTSAHMCREFVIQERTFKYKKSVTSIKTSKPQLYRKIVYSTFKHGGSN